MSLAVTAQLAHASMHTEHTQHRTAQSRRTHMPMKSKHIHMQTEHAHTQRTGCRQTEHTPDGPTMPSGLSAAPGSRSTSPCEVIGSSSPGRPSVLTPAGPCRAAPAASSNRCSPHVSATAETLGACVIFVPSARLLRLLACTGLRHGKYGAWVTLVDHSAV